MTRCQLRRGFAPVDRPWAWPSIWLGEYPAEERDFRYRPAGEAINEAHGRNLARLRHSDVIRPSAFPPSSGATCAWWRSPPSADRPACCTLARPDSRARLANVLWARVHSRTPCQTGFAEPA